MRRFPIDAYPTGTIDVVVGLCDLIRSAPRQPDMIDTPDDLLLLEAEPLARDLLLDADHTQRAVARLLNGWVPVIRASSRYYAPLG